ncbi:copper chaperone PCu(A)C [Colwellia sp. MEBiC06753]
MTFFYRIFSTIALSLAAHSIYAAEVEVSNGYIREVIPGNKITSAYMTIDNLSSKTIKLVGAKSEDIPTIEIHEHVMTDGMMKMGQVPMIAIEANAQIKLQPMGYHLMMFGVDASLKAGKTVEVTLLFDGAEPQSPVSVTVMLPVESIKQAKSQHHHH